MLNIATNWLYFSAFLEVFFCKSKIYYTFAARIKIFFHHLLLQYNMNQYEVTFIIDPVLSGDEIKSTASTYQTLLKDQGCTIVHVNEMGLKQLAYPELALRRDERIMRFLTVKLDKYGVKYNEDRRSGKISAYKKKEAKKKPYEAGSAAAAAPAPAPAPVKEEIAPAPQPEVVTPVAGNEEE